MHHGSLRPGRTPRRSLAGPRLGEQSREGEGGAADASSDLNTEDDQPPAAQGLPEFRASPGSRRLRPRRLVLPAIGEAVGDHLYTASVARGHVAEGDMRCDAGTGLLADASRCPLQGASSPRQHSHLCAGRPVVAVHVQESPASVAFRGERER